MEGGKWEDLNMDCLVNVFGRVGIESLLLDIPFVCKSWFKATLSCQSWHKLDFSQISIGPWFYYDGSKSSRLIDKYQLKDNWAVTEFIKYVIKRSKRSATFISLPGCCTEEALIYIAEECPGLKTLMLPLPHDHMLKIPKLISNWKSLEFLRLGNSNQMQEFITEISIHCNNFVGLSVVSAYIWKDEASAIVTLLPNINYLSLRYASMKKENLVMILQGCKELEYVDVRDCIGFNEGDDEILKFASHIRTFKHKGSCLFDDVDYCHYEDNVDLDFCHYEDNDIDYCHYDGFYMDNGPYEDDYYEDLDHDYCHGEGYCSG
ncbi:F-box/LRR-repeat protein [Camellia lanceoleosa]|uniref:F-box/LRR-repeat protein n=1 Tax=Camellia lanceoleosa TaxID=1840588 RepID=A0ACC0GNF0_9ERIC|nr:F-box/LRR-repeat protein [Camellia lanceoleosa]